MILTRRRVMQLTAMSAAALAGSRTAVSAATAADADGQRAARYFRARGFADVQPLPMITGDGFNGGLRYDDTRADLPSVPEVIVQPSARVDDIVQRSDIGVLAGFNILAVRRPGDTAEAPSLLKDVMTYLVEERGLDPDRMLFVSTGQFRPHLDTIDGVTTKHFIERPLREAEATGDGSGMFAPKGHPQAPREATASIHYRLPQTLEDTPTEYPPRGYIELGEVGLSGAEKGNGRAQIAGFGLERVAIAAGEPTSNFEETRLNLLRVIEDEARRTGKDLPPGYTKFASL
jgi:hypothetical protein